MATGRAEQHLAQLQLQRKLNLDTKKGWHAWRVYFACALLSCKHSSAHIQALCHWRTIDAEQMYARLEPADFAASLCAAAVAQVSNVLVPHLPQLDCTQQIQQIAANAEAASTGCPFASPAKPPTTPEGPLCKTARTPARTKRQTHQTRLHAGE